MTRPDVAQIRRRAAEIESALDRLLELMRQVMAAENERQRAEAR